MERPRARPSVASVNRCRPPASQLASNILLRSAWTVLVPALPAFISIPSYVTSEYQNFNENNHPVENSTIIFDKKIGIELRRDSDYTR